MKRKLLQSIIVVVVMLVGGVVASLIVVSPARPGDLGAFQTELDKRISALMAAHNVPGVGVALIHQGKTVSVYYGLADRATNTAVGPDTVF